MRHPRIKGTLMIAFRTPTTDEMAKFLDMFRGQLGDSELAALSHLGISWDTLAQMFTSVGEVRCVLSDDVVAGFAWIEFREPELHVHGIVLSDEFRGRGIGRAVFHKLQDEFRAQAEVIELGVQKGNKRAIGFYEHLGCPVPEWC
jgi:ribosomal protein S18 acetylase RimI-like enzyme